MTRLILIAALLGALLGVRSVGHAFADSAASDAAHMCQQGGYATLMGTDGTKFQNAGQCTSFVAKGGTIMNVPACTVVSGVSGCLLLDNATTYLCTIDTAGNCVSTSSTNYISFTGVISFTPTYCTNGLASCDGTATGGGSYTITGTNAQTGAFQASGTSTVSFLDPATGEAACSSAPVQEVGIQVTFTSSTGAQSTGLVGAVVIPASPNYQLNAYVGSDQYQLVSGSPVPGVTIQC